MSISSALMVWLASASNRIQEQLLEVDSDSEHYYS